MSKPSVLIVGAGALGVATGYHLNLAGAAVTYLVRPARLKALQAAQVLYCYDDAQLKHFSDYHAVDCVAEAAKQNYDFVLVTLDLAGWPDAKTMADNQELMSLCSKAMQEIMRLPEHGWQGKLASLLIRQTTLAKNIVKTERDCLPLDNTGFNKFHHGGKVREQDIQVMRQCAESGKTQHKSMPALDEIIRRYELHCEH
jgi:Ketopantoate reductase PanE/ApbA